MTRLDITDECLTRKCLLEAGEYAVPIDPPAPVPIVGAFPLLLGALGALLVVATRHRHK